MICIFFITCEEAVFIIVIQTNKENEEMNIIVCVGFYQQNI